MQRTVCFAVALLAGTQAASAQNLLVNPGFESGLSGWTAFGNVFAEVANPPAIVPNSGNGVVKMFGGFSGGFSVGGLFQEFATTPGTEWELSGFARHFSGDALFGGGAPNSNWVVAKMAFFNSSNTEIGFAERTVLDGTFATDVWHNSGPILGTAPAGTVKVQAFFLFLQPGLDGGAAFIDDASFSVVPAPSSALVLAAAGVAAARRRRR